MLPRSLELLRDRDHIMQLAGPLQLCIAATALRARHPGTRADQRRHRDLGRGEPARLHRRQFHPNGARGAWGVDGVAGLYRVSCRRILPRVGFPKHNL